MDNHAPGAKAVTIGLDWKTGINAKDWESVARKEKIEVSLQVYFFHPRQFPPRPDWEGISYCVCSFSLTSHVVFFHHTFFPCRVSNLNW